MLAYYEVLFLKEEWKCPTLEFALISDEDVDQLERDFDKKEVKVATQSRGR